MPTASRLPLPQPVGPTQTFGFGDPLGVATPGHLAAARKFPVAPMFAQQSVRELDRTRRTPADVLGAAQRVLAAAGFKGRWGADADRLRTEADATRAAQAGFTHFTLDPTALIEERADTMRPRELEEAGAAIVNEGALPADWTTRLVGRAFDLGDGVALAFDRVAALRAGVKFARALQHTQRMVRAIGKHLAPQRCELEFAIDESQEPTSPLEHVFCGLELRRRGVAIVGLAPRFAAGLEPVVDFPGDVRAFERELRTHVAIARHLGPYKISVHHGSDKFALHPTLGRVCGELLHIKTGGTSYLEAMRLVCRASPELFREIALFARDRFEADRASARVSTTTVDVDRLLKSLTNLQTERRIFESSAGRQLLHATSGSVLGGGATAKGRPFKDAILETVAGRADLYRDLLDAHFTRHLALLNAG